MSSDVADLLMALSRGLRHVEAPMGSPWTNVHGDSPTEQVSSSINDESFTCSDLDENGTIVLEMVKCGANLVSDQKDDFSRKWWGLGGCFQCRF